MSKTLNAYQRQAKSAAKKKRLILQALRKQGWSYQRIGRKYGISRQRVHQILKWEHGYRERLRNYCKQLSK